MSQRVARARELVAEGAQPTAVARVSQISRQSIYKVPKRRPPKAGPGEPGPDDARIVEIAKANPSDGTRMVAAIARGSSASPSTGSGCSESCAPTGCSSLSVGWSGGAGRDSSRCDDPDELWHMDMTKVWTAEHGWVLSARHHRLLHPGARLEAIACVERAVVERSVRPNTLTIGSDNGTQFTSRAFRRHLSDRGSAIGVAGTGIPSPRRSSSPGSGSSNAGRRGEPSGNHSTKQGETPSVPLGALR